MWAKDSPYLGVKKSEKSALNQSGDGVGVIRSNDRPIPMIRLDLCTIGSFELPRMILVAVVRVL